MFLKKSLVKGRQPYVELLAKYNKEEFIKIIYQSLEDSEISVQTVASLRIAKIAGMTEHLNKLLEGGAKYIGREARKYFKWESKNNG